jgi:hypothetical protein
MEGMGEYLKNKLSSIRETPLPQRGGITSYSSLLRAETATLLGVPFKQVAGLTRGFDVMQLERMLKASREWVNPPALWWKLYKTEKQYARKRHTKEKIRRVRGVGEKGRGEDEKDSPQGVLF